MILEVAYAMQVENEEREDELRMELSLFDSSLTAPASTSDLAGATEGARYSLSLTCIRYNIL